jgi:hypothetical protein
MAFEDHLSKACEYGEAGFHFEEGGCIAMALEIHAALVSQGRDAALAVDRVASHVFVLCEGMLLDHQGWNTMRAVDIVDEAALDRLAMDWQVHEQLGSDREWARGIIENACGMAAEIESSEPEFG